MNSDICRCLGLLPTPDGTQRCPKRDTCQRYTKRHTGGGPFMQWCCPTKDDYYGAYIESEPHASAVTT